MLAISTSCLVFSVISALMLLNIIIYIWRIEARERRLKKLAKEFILAEQKKRQELLKKENQ